MAALQFAPGTIIAGRFRVISHIDDGATASAYLAHDILAGFDVVCRIGRHAHDRESLKAQFRKLVAIRQRSVPATYGYFEHDLLGVMLPVQAVEYIDGPAAREWIDGKSLRDRLRVVESVGLALAALHREGIHHGDVHAGNVLIADGDRAVLIDLEAAALGSTTTRSARMSGSAADGSVAADLLRFGEMIEFCIGDLNPRLALHLAAPLNQSDGVQRSAEDTAKEIGQLLAGDRLPFETAGDMGAVADSYKQDRSRRQKQFQRNRIERHASVERIASMIKANAALLDVSVDGATIEGGALDDESRTDQSGRGSFLGRSISVSSPDEDRLLIGFDTHLDFQKPTPFDADPLCVCAGTSRVGYRGVVAWSERLQLRWHEDVLRLFAVRGGQPMLLEDEVWVQRALRVLIGEEIAGIAEDLASGAPKSEMSAWPSDLRLREENGKFDLDFSSGDAAWVDGIEWLRQHSFMFVAMSGLRLFFDAPSIAARRRLVAIVANDYLRDVGAYVDVLHRFDVRVVDPASRAVMVHIELTPHGGAPRSWEQRLELPEADVKWSDADNPDEVISAAIRQSVGDKAHAIEIALHLFRALNRTAPPDLRERIESMSDHAISVALRLPGALGRFGPSETGG